MIITKTKNGSALTVSAEGRLDTITSPGFEKEVSSELEGVTELVLDFFKLEYISSAGLRALLVLQTIMNEQGSMKITGANETVNEIFEVTGFSEILNLERH